MMTLEYVLVFSAGLLDGPVLRALMSRKDRKTFQNVTRADVDNPNSGLTEEQRAMYTPWDKRTGPKRGV